MDTSQLGLSTRLERILFLAIEQITLNKKSHSLSTHSSVLFNGNKPVSTGINSTNRTMLNRKIIPSLHAETSAILNHQHLLKVARL